MSYYSSKLYPFVEELIRSHNYDNGKKLYELSVDDLDSVEKDDFAKHLMIYKKMEPDCLINNDDLDEIMHSMLALLSDENAENQMDFANIVKEKVVEFYKNDMQKLIDDCITWVEQEDMGEIGFIRSIHKDNGESRWIKG